MLATPVVLDELPKIKSADEFSFSVQFKEDEGHYDLSTFTNVGALLTNGDDNVFSISTDGGGLSISSSVGSNNDIISGVIDSDTMGVNRGIYYLEVWTERDNDPTTRNTLISFTVRVSGAGEAGTTHEWLITITNSTDTATGERATNILALAVDYLNQLKIPETVIIVDGLRTGNQTPSFDNVDDAVTAAYAVISGGASKCVIRAYADASGVPYNLDDYDYYTLRDANIFFESPFDPWKDYVSNGGTISQSDLLYDVPQDELSISITG